ncbi:unnamed protein product [Symbiodinium sp. CCMP2592]|nr:unnamed protein product [Symbiodinium sp. CCMP2592]
MEGGWGWGMFGGSTAKSSGVGVSGPLNNNVANAEAGDGPLLGTHRGRALEDAWHGAWKWADVFPAEHIELAAAQFRDAKQHQEYALHQGLLGLRIFSGAVRPNSLPEDVKQRLKATNLVCRDQLVPMILGVAGPHSAYDQDQINNVVAWVSNGDDELGSRLQFSVLRFLQQLRDDPPPWTQRQGRLVDDDGQIARTHKELQAFARTEFVIREQSNMMQWSYFARVLGILDSELDRGLDVQEEPRESDDDIGDLPSVPPVSRTFINYRQGSEVEEGRTVTHREEDWDDDRRDTEREESVRKMVHFVLGQLKDAEISMKAMWMKQVAQQLSDANETDCDLHLKRSRSRAASEGSARDLS